MNVADIITQARTQGVSDGQIMAYLQQKNMISTPQAPVSNSQNSSTNWNDFVNTATQIAKQRNFPVSVLLGQAALESGHGTAAPGNNYFGIKGTGTAGSNNLPTQEYGNNGYYNENSNFSSYNTPADSINDYINLISQTPRYQAAWAARANPVAMIDQIHQAGYATDPTYTQQVVGTPEFQQNYWNDVGGNQNASQ